MKIQASALPSQQMIKQDALSVQNVWLFFFFCEKEDRFCDGPAHSSYRTHTQQEEESAALENDLSQPVKTGSPDFM